MGFSFGSPSSTSRNQTTINTDNRQQDNKIAAENAGQIVSTAGGNFESGTIKGSGNSRITINQTDPNSFEFASRLFDSLLGSNQQTIANASNTTSRALDTVAQLAAGQQIGGESPSSWKRWAAIAAVIAAVAGGAWYLVKRRK